MDYFREQAAHDKLSEGYWEGVIWMALGIDGSMSKNKIFFAHTIWLEKVIWILF